MSKRIQGITIELDGETKGLDKALRDVNKRSQDLNSELREVERGLKFNPSSVELLRQKQELLTQSIQNTTKKLNQLENAQSQVEEQFKSGKIGEEQYRAFRREIEKTSDRLRGMKDDLKKVNSGQPLDELKQDAKEAEKSISDLGGEISGLVGALVAGGGIAGAIESALDMSTLDTKIDIQFDVPEESKESVREAIKGIQAYGIDGESALEGVRRQWALNKDATDEANDTVVRAAGAISAAFSGVDFTELIQETNEIASGIDITNQNALALVDSLLKAGFPPEQLDTIAEYGQQMKDAGFSAAEIQAIFEAGIDTKTWNIDNLNDGVKEARIQMASFGEDIPNVISDLLEGTEVSSKQWGEWGEAVAEGGAKGSEAMGEVVAFLDSIPDKAKQNALATQVFGTKWEDQGNNMIAVFEGVAGAVDKTEQNTNGLYETMGKINSDPAVELEQAFNQMKEALRPLLTDIVEFVTKVSEWIAENPKLAATIVTISTVLGVLIGVITAVAAVVGILATAAGVLNIALLPFTAIIFAIIAAIAALIAIGVLLYQNWDKISAVASAVWSALKDWLIRTISNIVAGIAKGISDMRTAVADRMEKVRTAITDIWGKITGFFDKINLYESGKAIIQSAIDGILAMANPITNAVENIVGLVRDYWPFSPAKRGPLSDIDKMDFAGPIGDSIKKAENPLLRNMESLAGTVAGVMPQMSAPSTSGSSRTSTVNLADMLRGANIHIRKDSDIEDLARQLARYIKNSPGVSL